MMSVLLVEYCPPVRCHLNRKVGTILRKSISWPVALQTIQGERGRQRTKSGGSLFNKITGLPLHSSPAPLSRQRKYALWRDS
ncbi:hypothetical protein COOONC_17420 [Cooperia oncophora]